MKKLAALALTLMMLTACVSGIAESGGTTVVRIGQSYDPTTLDYAEANLDSALFVLAHTAEALMRETADGSYECAAAESYEVNEDATDWTFHLRQGLTYSDGTTPITAEDFYYAATRLIDPAQGHGNASFKWVNSDAYYGGTAALEDVGVKVLDDYTIEYTFIHPAYESSFTSTSMYAPLEQSFVEAAGEAFGTSADTYLGNGPMMVSAWTSDASVTLVKNPSYRDPASVTVDEIDIVTGASGDVAVDMMLAGELDIAPLANANQIATLEGDGCTIFTFTNSYYGLNLNPAGKTEESGKLLSNANFRKALSLAIDREALNASVMTAVTPANRLTAPSELAYSYNPDYVAWPTTADAASAQEYLQKALDETGMTMDDMPVIELLCYESQGSIDILSAIQDMLRTNLGIETLINPQTIQVMISDAMSGNYDLWLGGNGVSVPDACESYLDGFYSVNYAPVRGYMDPDFDALYLATVSSTTIDQRMENYAALEAYFCDNVMNVVLGWQSASIAISGGFSGYYTTSGGTLILLSLTK